MRDIPDPIINAFEIERADGVVELVISGNDPDAVWAAGLDVKNAAGLVNTPLLGPLEPAAVTGWWMCRLTQQVRDVPL